MRRHPRWAEDEETRPVDVRGLRAGLREGEGELVARVGLACLALGLVWLWLTKDRGVDVQSLWLVVAGCGALVVASLRAPAGRRA